MNTLCRSSIAAALILFTNAAFAQTRIWRCPSGHYTNEPTVAEAQGCKYIEGGNVTVVTGRKKVHSRQELEKFQTGMKVGDYSAQGLIVEIKPPVVKVQTNSGERWFRIDELSPR